MDEALEFTLQILDELYQEHEELRDHDVSHQVANVLIKHFDAQGWPEILMPDEAKTLVKVALEMVNGDRSTTRH